MTVRLSYIALDARDVHAVAAFWCAALGWRVVEEDEDGVSIAGDDPAVPGIDVLRVPEGKSVKNRLHLDLRPDATTQQEEVDRLIALGARRVDVGQPDDAPWVVLADVEGNELCVLRRSVQEAAEG